MTANNGTYAAVKYTDESVKILADLQSQLELYNPTPASKIHTTICFSREKINFCPSEEFGPVWATGFDTFECPDGNLGLVLLLDSPYLRERFEYAKIMGATSDFPDYRPHITLTYEYPDSLEIPVLDEPFELEISEEYTEDLDLDWKNK